MKKILALIAVCLLTAGAFAQDSMNKKMDNSNDRMIKKMDNKTDKMNKKLENVPAGKSKMPDSTVRRSRPRIRKDTAQ